LVTSL
jgi:hypothetical protein